MRGKYTRSRSGISAGALFRGLVLVVLGLVGGYFVWAFQFSRVTKFDRFNFVVSTPSSTSFVSLDTKANDASVVLFPNNLYIASVAHGYGQYTISRVFDVGNLDKRGGVVLTDTVADYLGVPVDGYVRFSSSVDPAIRSVVSGVMFTIRTKQTNLGLVDRMKLAWILARMRFDKMHVVDLSHVATETLLADGSTGLSMEKENLDSVLSDEFSESSIRKEDLRVEVINATQISGLGARAARTISNIGGKVISVETRSDRPEASCQLRVEDKLKNSVTVSRLSSIYGCSISKLPNDAKGEVSLVVGSDFQDKFEK